MAQNLTQRLFFACADVGHIIVLPSKSAARNGEPERAARHRRPALCFRSVNARGAPGYDPGLQRHHLLPRELLSKRCFGALFEQIGRDSLDFDDFRGNGMLLPSNDAAALRFGLPLHRGPHPDYNAMVIERVGKVEAHWSSLRRRAPHTAHGDAVSGLQLLQRALRRRLLNPTRKRLELNRFDPLGGLVDFTDIDAMIDSLWAASDPSAAESTELADQAPAFTPAPPNAIPVRAASPAFA